MLLIRWFKLPSDVKKYDPVSEEFKKKTELQKFCCLYPQQRVYTKYYERNCDAFAVKLFCKAQSEGHEFVVRSLFDEEGKVKRHLRMTPHLAPEETQFSPDFTYDRGDTLI